MSTFLFLLPPSEGKRTGGNGENEVLSFPFPKPKTIACSASDKDLKCSGKRYAEALELNQKVGNTPTCSAIERYNGVMYHALDYPNLSQTGKVFFNKHFLILSGYYGLLKPQDRICNYKLPIATKGLYDFWGEKITKTLMELQPQLIISLLPHDYLKMLINKASKELRKSFGGKFVHLQFLDQEGKKLIHNSKSIKGERIKKLSEKAIQNQEDLMTFLQTSDEKLAMLNLLEKL
ncbi:MAG: hypothetical protein DLD55_03710 [candidate division SR1 bacterium]|nr:MAG: hypothetical protein DLD55_03710 [candidate division SR1 bacterium]